MACLRGYCRFGIALEASCCAGVVLWRSPPCHEAEKINQSYLCRVLRLSLLAPDIVEGALNGTLSLEFTLERAVKPLPVGWVLRAGARPRRDESDEDDRAS